jgi:hypothetical protein
MVESPWQRELLETAPSFFTRTGGSVKMETEQMFERR